VPAPSREEARLHRVTRLAAPDSAARFGSVITIAIKWIHAVLGVEGAFVAVLIGGVAIAP
jgi:hypothetical protein